MKSRIKKQDSAFASESGDRGQKSRYGSLSPLPKTKVNDDISEAGGELLGHSYSMFKMGQTLTTFQVKISIIGYIRSHSTPVNSDQLFLF
jgi:hypothetical protein